VRTSKLSAAILMLRYRFSVNIYLFYTFISYNFPNNNNKGDILAWTRLLHKSVALPGQTKAWRRGCGGDYGDGKPSVLEEEEEDFA